MVPGPQMPRRVLLTRVLQEFWSEGQANDYDTNRPAAGGEYKVRACRSTSLEGPYADQNGTSCLEGGGNYVLESHGQVYGPGAQGIYDDSENGVVMYYRYGEPRTHSCAFATCTQVVEFAKNTAQ